MIEKCARSATGVGGAGDGLKTRGVACAVVPSGSTSGPFSAVPSGAFVSVAARGGPAAEGVVGRDVSACFNHVAASSRD